jgi:hypothetical protein
VGEAGDVRPSRQQRRCRAGGGLCAGAGREQSRHGELEKVKTMCDLAFFISFLFFPLD